MKPVERVLLALALAGVPTAGTAHDAFPFGEADAGRKIFETHCVDCHVRRFGDAGASFVRNDRKARDANGLFAWVQRCNSAMKTNLGREEEEHLAAYLNAQFYMFK